MSALGSRIGLLGVGNMGQAMARRLIGAGRQVVAYDVDPMAREQAAALGAALASSPAELGNRCQIVLASLPYPDTAIEAATGRGGIIEGTAVKLYVEHSTIGPSAVGTITERLAACGITLLDAPVTGAVVGADQGALTVLAAGPVDAVETVRPIVQAYVKEIVTIGQRPGQAQVVKLANNLIVGATMVATTEALLFAMKAGLAPQTVLQAINAGSAGSFASRHLLTEQVLPRRFDSGFALRLMAKDLTLCCTEATEAGADLALGALVTQTYEAVAAETLPDTDMTEVVKRLERAAKLEIRAP